MQPLCISYAFNTCFYLLAWVFFIQDVVSSNCVVIFSKTTFPKTCHNCHHKYINSSIFINGQCIGGGTDTKLHQQGKLLSLIEQCSVC
uniref:Uncharacterized protein n=1 Tax=Cyprinus carpio TaxID=7962 RepID=A0A8C1ZCU0_CYPCA